MILEIAKASVYFSIAALIIAVTVSSLKKK